MTVPAETDERPRWLGVCARCDRVGALVQFERGYGWRGECCATRTAPHTCDRETIPCE